MGDCNYNKVIFFQLSPGYIIPAMTIIQFSSSQGEKLILSYVTPLAGHQVSHPNGAYRHAE